eukprot:3639878-Pyramimonas_sp.AAC.1
MQVSKCLAAGLRAWNFRGAAGVKNRGVGFPLGRPNRAAQAREPSSIKRRVRRLRLLRSARKGSSRAFRSGRGRRCLLMGPGPRGSPPEPSRVSGPPRPRLCLALLRGGPARCSLPCRRPPQTDPAHAANKLPLQFWGRA